MDGGNGRESVGRKIVGVLGGQVMVLCNQRILEIEECEFRYANRKY
jgi:hypothetical protein